MDVWQWLGVLHPKLVQFPLVLLLVGLLFDLAGVVSRWRGASQTWVRGVHTAALAISGLGTVGLLLAFICGIYAEIWAGRAGVPQHPMELHELMANVASWGFVVLLAWRIFLGERPESLERNRRRARQMVLYVAIGLSWYCLLGITGWLGGQLVFEYGAGVHASPSVGTGGAAGGLTLEDLNTLAARQTDENLRYSEWMHHIFGWLTLGLAASLLAQALWPSQRRRLRWIVPAFLLAGGLFLLVMADRDLYALTDLRQFRDREVQLHKTLAIIMMVIGISGLWKSRGPASAESSPLADPAASSEDGRGNSRLVAVLALIGGAMLFTHIHSVAPYANVAAGVYIAHVVMGLTALAIGLTRILQDWFAAQKVRQSLRIAFACMMAVEAGLLVTYNEGLPWFIGYGRYNRWGAGESAGAAAGTIAPYGKMRARLRVDQQQGRAIVDILDRFEDKPFPIPADRRLKLLVGEGGREIAVDLHPPRSSDLPQTSSRFEGEADFLKLLPAFSARLALPVGPRDALVMGYFDPWVTPAIAAIPPNEVAGFECPMHEGMRSIHEGTCPLCGMPFQPIRPHRPPGVLHDAGFDLRIALQSGDGSKGASGGAGHPTAAAIEPLKDGVLLNDLAIVHEQPIHLIVVSAELDYFDHVHPTPAKDGTFRWTYTFPRTGRYLLFAELTPRGERSQVFRVPLDVDEHATRILEPAAGEHSDGADLHPDQAAARLVQMVAAARTPQDSAPLDLSTRDNHREFVQVQLVTQPRTLVAGLHSQLLFRLADAGGRPIVDLQPYLGALGHCMIISQDTADFVHSHPQQFSPFAPTAGGGPEIAFSALFPRPGRYRLWAQFKRPGAGAGPEMVIASFDVEVKQSWIPASMLRFLLNE